MSARYLAVMGIAHGVVYSTSRWNGVVGFDGFYICFAIFIAASAIVSAIERPRP